MGWAAKPFPARQGCVKSDDLHGFVALRLRAFLLRLQLRAFTLYGATKIVASATRLLADRAESFSSSAFLRVPLRLCVKTGLAGARLASEQDVAEHPARAGCGGPARGCLLHGPGVRAGNRVLVYANAAPPLRPRQGADTLLGHSQITVPFKSVLQPYDHNREAMLVQAVDTAPFANAETAYAVNYTPGLEKGPLDSTLEPQWSGPPNPYWHHRDVSKVSAWLRPAASSRLCCSPSIAYFHPLWGYRSCSVGSPVTG